MTTRSRHLVLCGVMVAAGVAAAVAGSRALHRPLAGFSPGARTLTTARPEGPSRSASAPSGFAPARRSPLAFIPRHTPLDTSGFGALPYVMRPWKPDASLEQLSQTWQRAGFKGVEIVDQRLAARGRPKDALIADMFLKAALLNYEGEVEQSYTLLEHLKAIVESDDRLARGSLASVIYFQGVDALRIGENENCFMCRGEASCILPIRAGPFIPTPRARDWRSATSRNISNCFPTISRCGGYSIWLT